MTLKILHSAVSMNPSKGVIKQMEWEQQAAQELRIAWKTVLHTGEDVMSPVVHRWRNLPSNKLLRYITLRIKFYKWLELESVNYDLVLLRFSVHDPWQSRLAKKIGHKLLTVHHTKEECELLGHKGTGRIKLIFENIFGRQTIANARGLVAVTPEVLEYQYERLKNSTKKQGFIYPNGILSSGSVLVDERDSDVPELVFVASLFAPWHGLDILLRDIKCDKSNFILHVVGEINDHELWRSIDDDRVIFHGHLNSFELDRLMNRAWCGLSSFAMNRIDMSQACTLKVREYLDSGLPVYAGHKDSGLPEEFEFFKNGEAKLSEILSFAKKMRSINRNQVSEASRPYISKSNILHRFYHLDGLN